jgi:hypothetical protein
MIRFTMRSRLWPIAGLALAGAQGGHLLAYQLQFGPAAQQVQSSGAHGYFPLIAKTTLGAVALTLLGALLLIGAARVVALGHRARIVKGPSFIDLVAALFTLQLALFGAQEVIEHLVAGLPPDSASHLLLWGMVGQLPVALIGASALRWLGTRVEAALVQLGSVTAAATPALLTVPYAIHSVAAPERAVVASHSARARIVKRGPPTSSNTASF